VRTLDKFCHDISIVLHCAQTQIKAHLSAHRKSWLFLQVSHIPELEEIVGALKNFPIKIKKTHTHTQNHSSTLATTGFMCECIQHKVQVSVLLTIPGERRVGTCLFGFCERITAVWVW